MDFRGSDAAASLKPPLDGKLEKRDADFRGSDAAASLKLSIDPEHSGRAARISAAAMPRPH